MPDGYKWLAIAILALLWTMAVFFSGWDKGNKEIQVKFDAYKQSQTILAQEQSLKAKEQEAENEQRTYQVAQAYSADLDRLNAALRLRKQSTSGGAVPSATIGSQGTNATGTIATGTCEGTGFYERALQTELMLESWQKWAVQQKIPVR